MSPFDDFRRLLATLPEGDEAAAGSVRDVFRRADAQASSLGRIEEVAEWLARWSGRAPPAVTRPLVAIFAGNHGVASRGISSRPVTATAQAVEDCASGAAAITQICAAENIGLKVFDLGLDVPTGDITVEAAMDERGCAAAMAFGMEAIAGGADLLCLGDLGVGNSTVAAAILAAIHGGRGSDWVGSETEFDQMMVQHQVAAVDAALAFHAGNLGDPLEILRRVGGREFAAIAGAILAARTQKIPVVLDGMVSAAAAAILDAVAPGAADHCLASHVTPHPGHGRALAALGLDPLLDLALRKGDGVGSALAVGLVRTAARCAAGLAQPHS